MNPTVQIPPEVDEVVGPHFELITHLVERAWEVWLEGSGTIAKILPRVRPCSRTIGSTMNDLLRALAADECAEHPQIRCFDFAGLFCMVIDEKVVIRFNLMDKHGMTMHTPTRQSEDYLKGQLAFEGFKPERFLYAGYVLDKTKTEILNIYLLERQRDGLPVWIEDVKHQFVYAQTSLFDNRPAIETTEEQAKRVTAKKDVQQTQTGTDDVPF